MPIQLPFFVVPRAIAAVTSSNERTNRPAGHLAILSSVGLVWRTNGVGAPGSTWIVADFGASVSFDFVALVNTNAQPGTTHRIRTANTLAGTTDAPLYDSFDLAVISPATVTNTGLYHSHVVTGPQTARYVRIDVFAHIGDFEAASLIVGTRASPSRFYDGEWTRGAEDLGDINMNRWGVAAVEPGRVLRTLGFRLSWLNKAEYELGFRPMLEDAGKRGLVYWCFDPEPTPDRQRKTYLGRFKSSLIATASRAPGRMTISIELLSII